jgi:hypothetical protein
MIARDSRPIAPLSSAIARSDLALAATTATGPTPKTRRSRALIFVGLAALAAAGVVTAVVLRRSPNAPAASPPTVAVEATPAPPAAEAVAPVTPPPSPPEPAPVVPTKTVKHDARPKVGTVVITIAGADKARIFVDSELVGQGVRTTTQSLTPGTHRVSARSKDHRPAVSTITVVAGRTQSVRLTLEKKPHSLNAVKDPFEDE